MKFYPRNSSVQVAGIIILLSLVILEMILNLAPHP